MKKKLGPDYHRLKTMANRSVEQKIRNKNFGARNGIMRRTPWTRIREQHSVYKEFLENVGNGSPSPSTTPMTTFTPTIAWCTSCVERAHRAD